MTSPATSPARPCPGFTPVPDALFDAVFPDLSPSELKVYLYLLRRTLGFGRRETWISLSQMAQGIRNRSGERLDRGACLHPRTIQRAIKSLEGRGLIRIRARRDARGHMANLYSLAAMPVETSSDAEMQKKDTTDTPLTASAPPPYGSTATPLRRPDRNIRETVYRDTEKHHQTGAQALPSPLDDVSFSKENKKDDPPMGKLGQATGFSRSAPSRDENSDADIASMAQTSGAAGGAEGSPVKQSSDDTCDIESCVKELSERGITGRAAQELVDRHGVDRVRQQLERFDALKRARPGSSWRNPAGWLRRAIEESYPESAELAAARQKAQEAVRERREAEARQRELDEDIARRTRLEALRARLSPQELVGLKDLALKRLEERGTDLRFGREIMIRLEMDRLLEERWWAQPALLPEEAEEGRPPP